MIRRGRRWLVCLLFAFLVLATRYPYAPGQFFTFDDVNLAYAVGHFDVRISQPQPPGYPLFVLEMRILYWLRFRRPESILLVLALAGSLAVLYFVARFGEHAFGGLTGFFAASLLALHPVFWHAGITSALRVQLALVSVLAAAACWRAWNGEGRWVLGSAVTLGLCAGVRPEIGPVLFPLWAASALRAPVTRKDRAIALGAMAAAVLLWLLPAMLASGGPIAYVKACLGYLGDQAAETSALFGAVPEAGHTTFWRLIAWTCCGMLCWTFPAVLAWRRKDGWGLDRGRLLFLALWLLPPLAFSLFVHIQDPGQSLAVAPPIALLGGHLFNRALENLDARVSRWQTITLVFACLAVGWVMEFRDRAAVVVWLTLIGLAAGLLLKIDPFTNANYFPRAAAALCLFQRALDDLQDRVSRWRTVILALASLGAAWVIEFRDRNSMLMWLPAIGLTAGLLLKIDPFKNTARLPRAAALVFLLAPVAILNYDLFHFEGWYYEGQSAGGLWAAYEQALSDLNSGLALTSLGHIHNTLAVDDHSLREAMRLAAERPGQTTLVWEDGLVTWRKAAYYLHGVPIIVLEHQTLRSGSPPVIAVWKGPVLTQRFQGPAPQRATLAAGGRVVWLLNPRTEFYDLVARSFPLTAAGPVYFTDLPSTSGVRTLGEYEFAW